MVTLAKRATPAQARMMRVIVGAVLNTADAHGEPRDEWLARSIAKRAAGTLSAQWPEVLAASTRPSATGAARFDRCRACERRAELARRCVRQQRAHTTSAAAGRGSSQASRRPPLVELWNRLKRDMWAIRQSGDAARLEATVGLLKMIDNLQRQTVAAQ